MTKHHSDPIAAALSNSKVSELYTKVNSLTPIQLKLANGPRWTCVTEYGQTVIEYSTCRNPAEALAHELLHTELKLEGYKQYCNYVAKAPCPQRSVLANVLTAIDNEMQHTRMDRRFVDLGFDLKYFYEDADASAFKKIRRYGEKLQGKGSTVQFFMLYLTLIAPGGIQSEAERSQAKVFLLNKASASSQRKLKQIEAVIHDWRDSESLDAGQYIKEILNLLELPCEFWVSPSTDFPDSGFFTGAPFQVQDAEFN